MRRHPFACAAVLATGLAIATGPLGAQSPTVYPHSTPTTNRPPRMVPEGAPPGSSKDAATGAGIGLLAGVVILALIAASND